MPAGTPPPSVSARSSAPPQAAPIDLNKPLFRRISADRVRTTQAVSLRTDRDYREPPSTVVAAQQEANVVLVRGPWAFVQTDDGRGGWAEWSVAA